LKLTQIEPPGHVPAYLASSLSYVLFTDWIYPAFLVVTLSLYYCVRHRPQNFVLLVASYVFYAWWDWRFAGLLLLLTFVTYLCALSIAGTKGKTRRRVFLQIAIATSLGALLFFKYANFFLTSADALLNRLGSSPHTHRLNLILPIGISFYTFQTLSYVIDVYRGTVKPCLGFVDFALYVGFFPKLLAGPIERAGKLLPQIQNPRTITVDKAVSGVWLIVIGFFKKVAIADYLAFSVGEIFGNPTHEHPSVLLMVVFFYTIQIYCDFAGYIDIARGTARLFGFELSENFRLPYLARNITHFWSRWNITLSNWFRDYLFFPLGGIQKGRRREYLNVLMTMGLVGLWHGASWNFVVWGLLHGAALVVHRKVVRDSDIRWIQRLPGVVSWFLTLMFVSLSWVLFRSPTLHSAIQYFKCLVMWRWNLPFPTYRVMATGYCLFTALCLLLLVDLVQHRWRRVEAPAYWRPIWAGLYLGVITLGLLLFTPSGSIPFIYFRF
jgi:alginate O-acetyltransferase complex protein AlgI